MASTRILAQSNPAATTDTVLYTVPQGKHTFLELLNVANRSNSSRTFRIGISVGGGAMANEDYLYYNVTITGNNTMRDDFSESFEGVRLEASDEVRVYASANDLTFTLIGTEEG